MIFLDKMIQNGNKNIYKYSRLNLYKMTKTATYVVLK